MTLESFCRTASGGASGSSTDPMHLQEAVLNFLTLQHAIWPVDYAGLVIMRVLIESRWGDLVCADDKKRAALVRRFFNEVIRENCSRAVHEEPPNAYEACKTIWTRICEDFAPARGQSTLSTTASTVQKTDSGGSRRGGNSGRGTSRGGNSRGSNARGGTQVTPRAPAGPPASVSGLLVCFAYNSPAGCTRQKMSALTCQDVRGTTYTHHCNFWDAATSKHCLQQHPRTTNH